MVRQSTESIDAGTDCADNSGQCRGVVYFHEVAEEEGKRAIVPLREPWLALGNGFCTSPISGCSPPRFDSLIGCQRKDTQTLSS